MTQTNLSISNLSRASEGLLRGRDPQSSPSGGRVRVRRSVFTAVWTAVVAGLSLGPAEAAEGLRANRVETLPTVPPGFIATLVAREPLVRNPCAMAFDSRGRLFVG